MSGKENILVITTSSHEGLKIIRYIKPVSAHFVADTEYFGEMAASLNDVIGVHSRTFQKEVSLIYEEAVEKLKTKAFEAGGNCILGMKIDTLEISGKGRKMFMITASGTAVLTEDKRNVLDKSDENINEVISTERMDELRRREEISRQIKNNELKLNEDIWKFITENSMFEIGLEVLKQSEKEFYAAEGDKRIRIFYLLLHYFNSIQEDKQIDLLYRFLMEQADEKYDNTIIRLMDELHIFDQKRILLYLNSQDDRIRRKALQLTVIDKKYFEYSDIKRYQALIESIESKNFVTGELTKKKKMLSSKEIDIWVCQCGAKNKIGKNYCVNCKRDIYGFYESETNPSAAVEKLQSNIEIIKKYIKN
ncbi:MAG TPA: heavy metal-binding domain-containing protein [Clostridiales bacterium]|jgi:uncharacterized protein YbjQ (UPF0145 family)|nr:heavy metal-binding domain-containing protein [Clostridiales bacterium]HQP69867.1 heavy metal-binding domain-containing protein [Clostridiales bacterium]